MGGDFGPEDVRLMQGLAQRAWALRPELVNSDATVGELAWVWAKDHADLGHTWRRRFWYDGDELAGWGWIFLPYRVQRSDGKPLEVANALLTWQVHPDRPDLLDAILDWYDAECDAAAGQAVSDAAAGRADRAVTVRAADADALGRLAAHGFRVDARNAGDDGFWTQFNARELAEVAEPVLPPGFRFRTAGEVSPHAAAQAHRDAWHPSTFTDHGMEAVRRIWPYREDLHVLVEAPDGTLAATAIAWFDDRNRVAEFEPVGTHRAYRRQGLGSALLLHGMHRAREAGATRMLVACLGAPAHPAARGLYTGVGFRAFTRDLPHHKPAQPTPAQSG